jgi:hypothetical protein
MELLMLYLIKYGLIGLLLLMAWAWGTLALYFAGPGRAGWRYVLPVLFVCSLPAMFYLGPSYWHSVIAATTLFALLYLWWFSLKPTNNKNWHADVARIPHGQIDGDMLTLHNVRKFHYRTRADYDAQWETRNYDLSKIVSLDLFLSYWGSPHIAHTILSWGFANGDHLAISIETRKAVSQAYSSIKGFFKQYTLVYVAGDESDLIRLRTNIRKEEVYLYPLTQIPTQRARALLESYLRHMNRLVDRPEFYHALQMNCTSVIALHTRMIDPKARLGDWRMIMNGHIDEMLYERGTIRNDLPFTEVRRLSRVDEKMQQYDDSREFSRRLRAGLQL